MEYSGGPNHGQRLGRLWILAEWRIQSLWNQFLSDGWFCNITPTVTVRWHGSPIGQLCNCIKSHSVIGHLNPSIHFPGWSHCWCRCRRRLTKLMSSWHLVVCRWARRTSYVMSSTRSSRRMSSLVESLWNLGKHWQDKSGLETRRFFFGGGGGKIQIQICMSALFSLHHRCIHQLRQVQGHALKAAWSYTISPGCHSNLGT